MYGQFWNLPSIRQTPPFVGDVPKTWGGSLGVLFKPSLFDVWMEVWRFYQAFSVPNYHEICVWFRGIICSLKPLVSSFLNGNADFQAFFFIALSRLFETTVFWVPGAKRSFCTIQNQNWPKKNHENQRIWNLEADGHPFINGCFNCMILRKPQHTLGAYPTNP